MPLPSDIDIVDVVEGIVETENIDLNAPLDTLYGVDSLKAFELVMGIEDEFDIKISESEISDLKTTQQIINFVKEKCK
jgi:acyl carrier protein